MASHMNGEEDPWQDSDPWGGQYRQPQEEAPYPGASGSGTQAGRVFTEYSDGGSAPRVVHDVPPVWDGKDPERQLEPYLKLLMGWLTTTRTLKQQQGMTILNYSQGDLKVII